MTPERRYIYNNQRYFDVMSQATAPNSFCPLLPLSLSQPTNAIAYAHHRLNGTQFKSVEKAEWIHPTIFVTYPSASFALCK